MITQFGGDAVHRAVEAALAAVERGEPTPERRLFDFKEEAGRRSRDGTVAPGRSTNEEAAQKLAPEVACMCNTPGGGALILGVADDGVVIGTELSTDWLQVRLYQLLQNRITTVITEHEVRGRRVLIIRCPHAVEPIAWEGTVRWRIGDSCREIDQASWLERRSQTWGYDWSAQPSGVPVADVRDTAIAVARRFLTEAADERSQDLAQASVPDLLRRLAVVTPDSTLTNAGAILFVGRTTPALDYIRRPAPGADSEARVEMRGCSLLEELDQVFTTARAYNSETHIPQGLVIGRVRLLPERAVREAIVNGIAHREWNDPAPTLVEHLGATLRVTSPGSFFGGVSSENIINHPPRSRNALLAQALATLRIAERQGIGVDRMFGDMLRLGHHAPTIQELDGSRVLVVLTGETPDVAWMQWLREIGPTSSQNLQLLMCLHRLVNQWWVDAFDLAPYLQVTLEEARQCIALLQNLSLAGEPLTFAVEGVPAAHDSPVLGIKNSAWRRLVDLYAETGKEKTGPTRETVADSYARRSGRISSTELASIVGAHSTNVGAVLKRLEQDGVLEPSRQNRKGPGFFYRCVDAESGGRS